MAIIFVFTQSEVDRATALGVNHIRLADTTEESLKEFINNPIIHIIMPFINTPEEKAKLTIEFQNQVTMRKIWKGETQ